MKKQFKLHTIILSSIVSLSALTAPLQMAHASTLGGVGIEGEGEVVSKTTRPPLEIRNGTTDTLNFKFKSKTISGESKGIIHTWSMDGKEESSSYKTIEVKDFLSEDCRYGTLTVIRNDNKIFEHFIDSSGTFYLDPMGKCYYFLKAGKTEGGLTAPELIVSQKKIFLAEMSVVERAKENIMFQWESLKGIERQIYIKRTKGIILESNELKIACDSNFSFFPSCLHCIDFSDPYKYDDKEVLRKTQNNDLLKRIGYSKPSEEEIKLAEKQLINSGVGIFAHS